MCVTAPTQDPRECPDRTPAATVQQLLRPVKLQANDSGAWKNVIAWDATDDQKSIDAKAAAIVLQFVDPRTHFRIVTESNDVLMHLKNGEWKAWRDA